LYSGVAYQYLGQRALSLVRLVLTLHGLGCAPI